MTIPADDRSQKLTPNIVGEWVLEEASDPKFPFRLRIYTPNEPNLSCPFSYRIAGRAATSTSSACAKRASRQTAMRQRRPRGARLHTARPEVEARVRIASDERYPWHLAPFVSERGPLPSGDYALVLGGAVVAVVERKTFDGLLAEFGRMDVLRQTRSECITGPRRSAPGPSPTSMRVTQRCVSSSAPIARLPKPGPAITSPL